MSSVEWLVVGVGVTVLAYLALIAALVVAGRRIIPLRAFALAQLKDALQPAGGG